MLRTRDTCTDPPEAVLVARVAEPFATGFNNLDALDLARAEAAEADVLAGCDDRPLAADARHSSRLRVRVVNPIALAHELFR